MTGVLDFGVPIANSVSLGLCALLLGALFQIIRTQSRREREYERATTKRATLHAREMDIMDYRIECQELETRHCQRNFMSLAQVATLAGSSVDPKLWEPAPLPTRRDPRLIPLEIDLKEKKGDRT